ncbi:hypothetical protein AB0I94_04185 [Streptomyces sp. NPDC050147]|uniref:hypothetical protein n=1 Tax=Streptomyces sp. NPDC050147 TaxID=3155513 RepID=UPI0034217A04
MTHLVPLAKEVDDDKVTPGVLGFIVFAVMAVAVWGLMKSMNKHMRKVDFQEPAEATSGSSAAATSGSSAAATSGSAAEGEPSAAKTPKG